MGSSFARTNDQKRQHKERSQPFNRERYGLLEKKKDYVLRSADYQQKQARLKTLRSKVANKNEDEFYFGMINKRTKNGLATQSRGNTALPQDVVKVLKTQDGGYIRTMASIERRKIDAIKDARHIPNTMPSIAREDDDARLSGKTHAVFVHDKEEMHALDPVERLGTTAKNLARMENRLRRDDRPDMSDEARLARRKMRLEKVRKERELESREKRLGRLEIMERETALQRQLQGKGARRKVGVDKDGVAKYKWKQERKR